MGLSLDEIKALIVFGRSQNLQTLQAEGVAVVYNPAPLELPDYDEKQPEQETASNLPPELRHYSAVGRAQLGRRA